MTTNSQKQFRAGAAKADISPVNGIQIAGAIGKLRACTGIADPIYARALVLEQNGRKFCILSIDVLIIDMPWADEIRRRIGKLYGIPRDAVMVHATQNHAAPDIGNDFCPDGCKLIPDEYAWLRGGDARYNEPAVAGVLEAVSQALARLTPVTVAAGRAIDNRIASNRRHIMRDGTARCQPPLCSPDILQVEGPIDPEVGIVTFTATDGQVVAALLHHTTHPCNGFWGTEVLPDWPGAWCQEMETHFGPACTPLVVNGCCGNIITFNYVNPDQPPSEIGGDYRTMGRMLAQSTKRALEKMTPWDTATFTWTSQLVPIPWREIPTQMLAEAKRTLEQQPQPVWENDKQVNHDWLNAVGILALAQQQNELPNWPYEIQALRLGDFALVAVGGEPFVETQLAIKAGSPFPFTHMAHMSNGGIGYIPSRRALAGGGYETIIGLCSYLALEAAETIEQSSVKILKQLAH